MQYDDLGNIIEEKEWRFKDTNQVENFITEKGEDLFLSVIFENPANYLDLNMVLSIAVEYDDKFATKYTSFRGSDKMEINYTFDDKKRLITSKYYNNAMYVTKYSYLYN